MGDGGRGLLEFWGIRLVLAALVLGLVWKFLYFPVWSASGADMRILLAFIVVEPLEFVVARVGPAAWIIGGVGAYLIESARAKLTDIPSRSWNRERIAIGFAVGAGATFLAGPGVIVDLPFTLWFLIHAATGIIVLIALGLYLLWTAERVARVSLRKLGSVAFAFALVAATLDLLSLGALFGAFAVSWSDQPPLTIADSLLGAGSLTIWILIYTLTIRRSRIAIPAVPSGAGA